MLSWFKKKHVARSTSPDLHAATGREQAEVWRAKGNACLDEHRFDDAVLCYQEALTLDARNVAVLVNLGFVAVEQGRLDDAQGFLKKAIQLDPGQSDAYYLIAKIFHQKGDFDLAINDYWRALAIQPNFETCATDLCVCLAQTGRNLQARTLLESGRAFAKDTGPYHFFSGNLYLAEDAYAPAAASFTRAAELAPDDVGVWINLGLAQHKLGDVYASVKAYQRALALRPDDPQIHVNLGGSFQVMGQLASAMESYRRAIELNPQNMDAHHNLLYAMSFHENAQPADYLSQAAQFHELVLRQARGHGQTATYTPQPLEKQPLRVGMVSGDLRNHAVGAFLEGVLAHIDPQCLELVAYSTRVGEDATTRRLKRHFAEWTLVAGWTDERLAAQVAQDRIDILMDLAGHTAHNRLGAFASKVAPVQVAWLGYWASTGMPEIDYILVDPVAAPDGAPYQFVETPWRLPNCRMCFSVPVTSRSLNVSKLPALQNGYVTFGSFQLLSKMNDKTLGLWATVLRSVPGARLRLQNWQLGHDEARKRMIERLAILGVDAGRVDIHGGMPRDDYLESHSQVDMILDTFPFPGGTTTAEALWMGVPTLTLSGETLLQRQGESLLSCAGMKDWVTRSDADYVERAVSLAADLQMLATLREGLRAQVMASPLFDARLFARHLEQALTGMWREKMGCKTFAWS